MMATQWVRRARPDEAASVVDIICGSFPRQVIERTVYGCAGIKAYVGAAIGDCAIITPTFIVAGTSAAPLAAAEVAANDDGVFLNYIGTRAESRSQGLGSSLLIAAADLYPSGSDLTMTLDVFQENARALEWYRSVGFEVIGERGWWELELSPASEAGAVVSGLPQAELCDRAFGFSEITLHTEGHSLRVGRLGTKWFRITSLAALESQKMMAALFTLDPRRMVLAMGGIDEPYASRLPMPIFRASRMKVPLTKLRDRISHLGR